MGKPFGEFSPIFAQISVDQCRRCRIEEVFLKFCILRVLFFAMIGCVLPFAPAFSDGALPQVTPAVSRELARDLESSPQEIAALAICASPERQADRSAAAKLDESAVQEAALCRAEMPATSEAADPAEADDVQAIAVESTQRVDASLDHEIVSEVPLRNRDPFEALNRRTFKFNRGFEKIFIDPVIDFYGWAVPEVMQKGAQNGFENLGTPSVAINKFLQGEPLAAGVATGRFVVNSTLGIVGLFDPAQKMGLVKQSADFGQTLYVYGLRSGPYMVVPLLGPTTVRDSAGFLMDFLFRPDTYLLTPSVTMILIGGQGLTTLESVQDSLDALRTNAVDEYALIRSLYLMHRASQLRGGAELTEEELEAELYFGE